MPVRINIQKHLGSESLLDEIGLVLELYPYLANKDELILTSKGEGYSLRANGLYSFLDRLCEFYDYPREKIQIETWNFLEKHNKYNIKIINQLYDCYFFRNPSDIVMPTKQQIGIFISRPDYMRLTLHEKLKHISWRDRLIYTFHLDLQNNNWPPGMQKFVTNGGSYKYIEKTTPANDVKQEVPQPLTPPHNIYGLEDVYPDVILEIVFETVNQDGFFVTEKTLRPMYYGKPVIVIGTPNFEYNMEQLGFNMDFNFPFDYRSISPEDKLNQTFDVISSWFLRTDLNKWYESIIPVLKSNQEVLRYHALNDGFIDLSTLNKLQ